MVGNGTGGHTVILGTGAEILEADGAIQQAVFTMAMQMDKIRHAGSRKEGWYIEAYSRMRHCPQVWGDILPFWGPSLPPIHAPVLPRFRAGGKFFHPDEKYCVKNQYVSMIFVLAGLLHCKGS
ncbi:MAG: hypothetical protein Q4F27_04830 [Desulfovibrionaceae bacterium]|nr:hypothetical protein [Desulfovibrionaceae bacterium]